MVYGDLAVERGFHGCRVAFPHFSIGEYDIRSAEEGEVQMFLVVLLRESIHVLTDSLHELFQVIRNNEVETSGSKRTLASKTCTPHLPSM
jgi:hypothetical protein